MERHTGERAHAPGVGAESYVEPERSPAPRRRIGVALISALALAAGLSALPTSNPSASQQTYEPPSRFGCRASLVRVGPVAAAPGAAVTVEPVVANRDGAPCSEQRAGVLNETTVVDLAPTLRLRAEALAADTAVTATTSAVANATTAHVDLTVASVTIKASMLSAHARVACPGPTLTSESTVANLTVGGSPIDVPTGQAHTHVALPGIGTLHVNEEIATSSQVTRRALWLETLAGGVVDAAVGDVIVAEATVGHQDDPCGTVTAGSGFMTGSGTVTDGAIHGVRIACDPAAGANNLQVESGKLHFHLETVQSMRCIDRPKIGPGSPDASFDTVEGSGTGRCNGGPATATWKLTDAGEPGRNDEVNVTVTGSCAFSTSGKLRQGNNQAHGSR